MVKLGSRPIGVAEAVLGEINFLRPQQGRVKAGGSSSYAKRGFSFSTRASQLWRFSLGSNAAVLKKIGKGGTANAKELAAQMDYLFSKSASIFGNGVVLDADAKGLTKDERNEIVGKYIFERRTFDSFEQVLAAAHAHELALCAQALPRSDGHRGTDPAGA